MRFYEIQTIKPLKTIKLMNAQQARLVSLKRSADSAKQAVKSEKDRQKVAKAQQQIFTATH